MGKAQKVTWKLTKRKQETGPGLYGRQRDRPPDGQKRICHSGGGTGTIWKTCGGCF